LKVSIITVTLNSAEYIEDCIKSVVCQNHKEIEHIVIDGGSTDGTIDVIRKFDNKIASWVSEPDSGIYDAMNKGIRMATGDVVGILNADDFYVSNEVISLIKNEFFSKHVDSVFADLVYVKRNNNDAVVRYYQSSNFHPQKFAYGWMPAHPTFFVKRHFYDQYGTFKTDYRIAADFELLVRFLAKYQLSFSYIPKVIIKMRAGGLSTKNIKSNLTLNNEIIRACRENGIKTNILKVYSKYLLKCFQLINRPQ
jgi:glycosyltransferase involved in cell wall biosynthesis